MYIKYMYMGASEYCDQSFAGKVHQRKKKSAGNVETLCTCTRNFIAQHAVIIRGKRWRLASIIQQPILRMYYQYKAKANMTIMIIF